MPLSDGGKRLYSASVGDWTTDTRLGGGARSLMEALNEEHIGEPDLWWTRLHEGGVIPTVVWELHQIPYRGNKALGVCIAFGKRNSPGFLGIASPEAAERIRQAFRVGSGSVTLGSVLSILEEALQKGAPHVLQGDWEEQAELYFLENL